ncbi:transglycosylase SLT domain-containing protein [Marinobacter confluentis]|uniref:Lysozyme-like domain containing protein n=1 Tax=Marinobacter confluentis TaxID=1697557 RepID=A0A4Z1BRD0_9GAMM|nr:lysozyme-like domain containing protein [Marinobacter confluentis]TGN40165.1 lysozyme-like domain containing protein [Marinobacter confluentis]
MSRPRRRQLLPATWASRLRWYGLPTLGLIITILVTLRFSLLEPDPPANPEDICEIFREHPVWYDYAKDSQDQWGTPIATQLAFVYYESSFRSHARPPRTQLLGFIPWLRPTTAYGYAQALDPAWGEYLQANGGGVSVVRTNMKYALDFVGWYNHLTRKETDITLNQPRELYLAYHEGRAGYRRQTYLAKPAVVSLSERVQNRAFRYDNQLQSCEQEFQCWRFYQFWPFCGDW